MVIYLLDPYITLLLLSAFNAMADLTFNKNWQKIPFNDHSIPFLNKSLSATVLFTCGKNYEI